LKGDIVDIYVSVDYEILIKILKMKIKEKKFLKLIETESK